MVNCRPGDLALLLPSNQQVVHECLVEHVGRETVVLKITEKARLARYLFAWFGLGKILISCNYY